MGSALPRSLAERAEPGRGAAGRHEPGQSQVCAPKLPGPECDRKGAAKRFCRGRPPSYSSATPLYRAAWNGRLRCASAQLGQALKCELLLLESLLSGDVLPLSKAMSVFRCIALLDGEVETGAASYCSTPHLLLYSESHFLVD